MAWLHFWNIKHIAAVQIFVFGYFWTGWSVLCDMYTIRRLINKY